jgi:hypothetical protein
MLYGERKRMDELSLREAAGESFWTKKFDDRLRTKIHYAMLEASQSVGRFYVAARQLILEADGLRALFNPTLTAFADFLQYLEHCADDEIPTTIEAFYASLLDNRLMQETGVYHANIEFEVKIRELLQQGRISFELVGGQMIPFESKELHAEVILPALALLSSGEMWKPAQTAYFKALDEISRGDGPDAITDAGTALQEALLALGCDGNSLGPLINSAAKKGLLGSHDREMIEAISKLMHWVSADRSQTGDAHNAGGASVEDAWLIVHMVGAIIVRLSSGLPRSVEG